MNKLLAVVISLAGGVVTPSSTFAQDAGRRFYPPGARSDAFDDSALESETAGPGPCRLRPRDFDLLVRPPQHYLAELRNSIETL